MPSASPYEPLKSYFLQLVPSMREEEWQIAESVLSIRKVGKGDMLVREGELCNHVFFIKQGLVRMYYLAEGKERIVGFCNENNYISEYESFLTRRPATMFVQALEATETIGISYADLQMLYEKVPVANKLGRVIAEKLFIEQNEHHRARVNQTVMERYDSIIMQQPWLPQRVPQYMIASMLEVTPEALSRIKARENGQKKLVMQPH